MASTERLSGGRVTCRTASEHDAQNEEAEPESVRRLKYELEMHAIELEAQNSELRRVQHELVGSRDRYRRLFDHAPVAFLTVSRDGTIAEANDKAAALLGVHALALIGAPLARFVAEADAARFEQHRRAVFETASPSICELELRRADGERVSARLESGPCAHGDSVASCAILDLTEIERTRAALGHAQRLEALGSLTSGITHDFNNLLMALQGSLDMLDGALAPEHAVARAHLQQARTCIDAAKSETRSLLAFCRNESPPAVVFDLHAALAAEAQFLKRFIGDDIEIGLSLEAADARVRASPAEIEQLLMNLVVNARDAMPRGGRITISTREAWASEGGGVERPEGGWLVLSVADTGTGMSEEVRARLFEPFFTTKESGRGTGLGLAIVHGVVMRAGGRITVRSELGVGTTFDILLPRRDEPIEVAERSEARPSLVGSETVLVVEDATPVRMAIRQYLEDAGYRVLEAENGQEAIECWARSPGRTHLLVTDQVMPGMRGTELSKRLRELQPDIAVLLTSANDVESFAGEALCAGTELLQKPFTAEGLLRAARAALARLSGSPVGAEKERGTRASGSPELRGRAGEGGQGARVPRARGRDTSTPRGVLVVDDNDVARLVLTEYLESIGWSVVPAANASEAVVRMRENSERISVVLTDYSLSDGHGDALARELLAAHPDARVVYLSGSGHLHHLDPPGQILEKPVGLQELAAALDIAIDSA